MRIFLYSLLTCILFFHDNGKCIEDTTIGKNYLDRYTDQKIPRLVLVTGCGRSGTGYMTEFLRAQGLDVGHEHMGKKGSVSWLMAAEVDHAPWGPLFKDYAFKHIFHQVRDPIKMIQSFYNEPPRATWEWIAQVIPEISLSDSDLTKCAKYWYYWNLMAEDKAEWTYRIEDIQFVCEEMGDRLGLEFYTSIVDKISKTTNTKGPPHRVITWSILEEEVDADLYEMVRSLAERYGYETPG
jgi:hypothetical protein